MSIVMQKVADMPDQAALQSFYDSYFETLDDGLLEKWPGFFTDTCLYRIIPRENYEAGYKLSTMQADGKGMLVDRVQGILRTQMFAPRYCRRFHSGLRVVGRETGLLKVRQNVLIVQTLINKQSEILLCGISHDLLEWDGANEFRFHERVVVIDSEMIPNSLIYPA
jgi:3-phenylpropionate/cinnamic acid dioxygenase small subunit